MLLGNDEFDIPLTTEPHKIYNKHNKCKLFGVIMLLNMVSFGLGFFTNHILHKYHSDENGSESI